MCAVFALHFDTFRLNGDTGYENNECQKESTHANEPRRDHLHLL